MAIYLTAFNLLDVNDEDRTGFWKVFI